MLLEQLEPRKFGIVTLQEICRKGEKVWKVRGGNAQFYQIRGATYEQGTGFCVMGRMQDRLINWKAINERMCLLRIKGRFFNYSIINVH